MVYERTVVVDLEALRASADHSPRIERQMVLLFMGTAERCLGLIQGLVVRGDSRDWQAVVHKLRMASTHIHAQELSALCKHIEDIKEDDAISRLSAFLEIKKAYEGLVMCLRNADLLTHQAHGG